MKKNILLIVLLLLSFAVIFISCGPGSIFTDTNDTSDDGDMNSDTTSYTINGLIQKGPFIRGSSITIQELNDVFTPTGTTYVTETIDDFGAFSIESELISSYLEIITQGFYFNEVAGALSSANLTLRAITELSECCTNTNINILTTLERERVKYLVINEGKSFTEARTQAETEILSIFNISEENISNFNDMDISKEGSSNAILLAISVILQGSNSVAELSEFISKISLDILTDGTLDNAAHINELRNNAMNLDLTYVKTNLENRYTSLGLEVTIPNFEEYIDSDGDGYINKYDFVVEFTPVTNATPQTEYISNSILVKLPNDMESATVVLDNGTLLINDGEINDISTAFVTTGDTISVKLTSSVNYGSRVEATLTCNNNTGTFAVITESNGVPIANAGSDQTVHVESTVTLDGSNSYDSDEDTLTYSWSFISKPSGSNATFTNSDVANPTFIPDKVGDYEIGLIVNDGKEDSEIDTVMITALNDAPNISNIAGQIVVNEDALNINFSISDTESNSDDLDIVVESLNTALIPDSSISILGNGVNRTVSISALPQDSGIAYIIITVTDPQGETAFDSFPIVINRNNLYSSMLSEIPSDVYVAVSSQAIGFGGSHILVREYIEIDSGGGSNTFYVEPNGIVGGGGGGQVIYVKNSGVCNFDAGGPEVYGEKSAIIVPNNGSTTLYDIIAFDYPPNITPYTNILFPD